MTMTEAAKALDVSEQTVRRWCKEGTLEHSWDGYIRRVPISAVMAKAKVQELQHA
jgi:excisionase family DNA binding protein